MRCLKEILSYVETPSTTFVSFTQNRVMSIDKLNKVDLFIQLPTSKILRDILHVIVQFYLKYFGNTGKI